ncbi:MAG: peptidase C39 bacteriocin processing [Deltaproteobacteria bacterium]|nr:peptidase C39 bacteriocin processing [Deltaproteobacteria bacterium]
MRIDPSLKSWKQLRDQNIVLQRFDYSCGAGALATIMRYYFSDDVSEEDILISILTPMSDEEVQDRVRNGLSLLDLKQCALRRGYLAVAVRLSYTNLPELKGPVIVYLERDHYRHFAVLRGVYGDRVYLADPNRGNVRMLVDRFAMEWSGIALVLGRRDVGLPQKYPLKVEDGQIVQNETLAARRSLFTK